MSPSDERQRRGLGRYALPPKIEDEEPMRHRYWLLAIATALALGCAAPNSIKRTNQLEPGMKPTQVKAIMGEPVQSQFVADKWVWKYTLHEPWRGFVPFYLVFSAQTPALQSWLADEAEYYRQQELWLKAMPPTQKHDVDVTIRRQ